MVITHQPVGWLTYHPSFIPPPYTQSHGRCMCSTSITRFHLSCTHGLWPLPKMIHVALCPRVHILGAGAHVSDHVPPTLTLTTTTHPHAFVHATLVGACTTLWACAMTCSPRCVWNVVSWVMRVVVRVMRLNWVHYTVHVLVVSALMAPSRTHPVLAHSHPLTPLSRVLMTWTLGGFCHRIPLVTPPTSIPTRHLLPRQLHFGVDGVMEAAVRSARRRGVKVLGALVVLTMGALVTLTIGSTVRRGLAVMSTIT